MVVIRAPKTDHKPTQEGQQTEDHRREYGQQFSRADDIVGNILDLEFDPTLDPPKPLLQFVAHGLGREPNGWVIQRLRPKAGISVIVEVAGTDDDRLALFATSSCFARIKVF